MRWRTEPRAVVLALLLASGACLEPGAPWGRVQVALVVAFDPPAERLDAGRIKTARDYRVEVERIDIEVAALAVVTLAEGVMFDPADPPAGYSLCHNGHCHSDDGRLVPYEEIAGGGAEGEAIVTLAGGEVALAPGQTEVVAPLTGCPPRGCDIMAPARIGSLELALDRIEITGRAFDGGAAGRLPAEGVPFVIDLPAVRLVRGVDAAFGPVERLGLAVAARLEVPAHLFDDLDFAAPTDASPELVRNQLVEHAAIAADLSRFD